MKNNNTFANLSKVLVLTILATGFALPAQSKTIEEKLNDLDQKQKILERKLEVKEEDSKSQAIVTASSDGFSFKSNDGKFQLKLKGLVQTDGRFFIGAKQSDNLGTNTFLARRVRPILEGTLSSRFFFRIVPDFGNGTTTLQDAYLDVKLFDQLKIRGGKFKEPVGLERLQSSNSRLFAEAGLPTNLVPNRDIGFQLFGNIDGELFEYAVGIFNGVADGSSADSDVNDGKDIAVRVFSKPFIKLEDSFIQNLGLGVGFAYGQREGSASSTGLPSFKTAGQQNFFRYRTDSTTPANTAIADGANWRVSPQLYFPVGPLGILGEYVYSSQAVRNGLGNNETLNHQAWQGVVSYVLTGEKASFNGVKPKNSFNPKEGKWGAVEVTGRAGQLLVDDDAFPLYANANSSAKKTTSVGGGVNWYLSNNFKAVANYERAFFDRGATGGDRKAENLVTTRLQLAF